MIARIVSILFLSFAILPGAFPGGGRAEDCLEIVARIGKEEISLNDISFRIKTEEAYGNYVVTREVALISLLSDAAERAVAEVHGVLITLEEIDSLRKYVDKNTKAPEILQKVKWPLVTIQHRTRGFS